MSSIRARRAILPTYIQGRRPVDTSPTQHALGTNQKYTIGSDQNSRKSSTRLRGTGTLESDLFVLQMKLDTLSRTLKSPQQLSKADLRNCFRNGKNEIKQIFHKDWKPEDILQKTNTETPADALVKLVKEAAAKELIEEKMNDLQLAILNKINAEKLDDESKVREQHTNNHSHLCTSRLNVFFSFVDNTLHLNREVERLSRLLQVAKKDLEGAGNGRLEPLNTEALEEASEPKVGLYEHKRIRLRLEASEKQLIEAQRQLAAAQRQVKGKRESQQALENSENQAKVLRERIHELESMNKNSSYEKLCKELSETNKKLALNSQKSQRDIEKLKQELVEQLNTIKRYEVEMIQLRNNSKELNNTVKELKQYENLNKKKDKELEQKKKQLTSLNTNLKEISNNFAALKIQDIESKKACQELARQLDELKEKNMHQCCENSKLSEKLSLNEEQVESLKLKDNKTMKEIQIYREKQSLLQGDLKQAIDHKNNIEAIANEKMKQEKEKIEQLEILAHKLKTERDEHLSNLNTTKKTIEIYVKKEEQRRAEMLKPLNDDFESVMREEMRVMKETFECMIHEQKRERQRLIKQQHEEIEKIIKDSLYQQNLRDTKITRLEAQLIAQRERIEKMNVESVENALS